MLNDNCYNALDFHITQNSPQQRGSYRVAAYGLSLYLDDVAQSFAIRDLSSSGCSLHAPADLFTIGRIFSGDLHVGDTNYLVDLRLKVIRHITGSSIACSIQTLSRRQEIMLDKLLLEIQKRSIATHAARRKRKKN